MTTWEELLAIMRAAEARAEMDEMWADPEVLALFDEVLGANEEGR